MNLQFRMQNFFEKHLSSIVVSNRLNLDESMTNKVTSHLFGLKQWIRATTAALEDGETSFNLIPSPYCIDELGASNE